MRSRKSLTRRLPAPADALSSRRAARPSSIAPAASLAPGRRVAGDAGHLGDERSAHDERVAMRATLLVAEHRREPALH